MQKRNVKYLLFISLAFNIAFLGGFAYRYFTSPFPPAGMHPEDMRPSARNFFFQKKEEIQEYGKAFMDSRKLFMDSLLAEDFSAENSLELMNESLQKQLEMETEIGKSMIEMRQKLSPEEANRVFGNMKRHMNRFEGKPQRRRH